MPIQTGGAVRRPLAVNLVFLLAAGTLLAQEPGPRGTGIRLGFGGTRMDFTCSECEIDAQTGISAFIGVSRRIGRSFSASLEGTFADAGFESGPPPEERHAKLFGPMGAAGWRGGTRLPVWATLGFGWLWYSGIGPSSNGPALSLRAGYDLGIGSLGFVTPYAGYVTMVGHDGPEVLVDPDPAGPNPFQVDRTRVASFQLGLAWTPRL